MNKILIVDYDITIRMLYAGELNEAGYDVFSIGDCTRVMAVIQEKRPDLVVMETKLGKHNGLDLLQDIRNKYHELPVILCTAYPAFKMDLKSIAADFYVVKSSSLEELKGRIRMVFRTGEPFQGATTFSGIQQMATL